MKTAMLAVVMGGLMFGQLAPFPTREREGTQEDPFVIYNSDTVSLSFNDTYTEDGFSLVRIEYQLEGPFPSTEIAHNALDNADGFVPEGGRFKFSIRDAVTPLGDGAYRLRVRVWDNVGNASLWTGWYYAEKSWRTVPVPGGCRLMP